jgi:hypothetical protein
MKSKVGKENTHKIALAQNVRMGSGMRMLHYAVRALASVE